MLNYNPRRNFEVLDISEDIMQSIETYNYNGQSCPIARALKDNYPDIGYIFVSSQNVKFAHSDSLEDWDAAEVYRLTKSVTDWIAKFDFARGSAFRSDKQEDPKPIYIRIDHHKREISEVSE